MDPIEVDLLMSVAISTARVLGFGIAAGCQQHLQSALQAATLPASAPPRKGEPTTSGTTLVALDAAAMLRLAEAGVAQYVAAMAVDAIRNGPPPDNLLHENNFFSILSWFCPCFPIC